MSLQKKLRRLAGHVLFAIMRFVITRDNPLTRYAVGVVKHFGGSYKHVNLYPVIWASSVNAGVVQVLAQEEDGISQGPLIENASITKRVKIPEVTLSFHENAVVCPESSSILVNGSCIIEDIKGVERKRCDYASGYVLLHGEKLALVRTNHNEPIKKGIFLAGNGSFNYYHWMIEILPKLIYLQQHDEHYDFPLLVGEHAQLIPVFKEALNVFKNERQIIFLKQGNIYKVSELLYISAVNMCPFNLRPNEKLDVADFIFRPSSIDSLRRKFEVRFETEATPSTRRIFLAREGSRRNYNQEEIFSIFEEYGFQKVYMEKLSLKEQSLLMNSAEIIVGPAGAAWTNLLFCRPGTACLSWLAEESAGFSAYSNLASLVGAKMHYFTYVVGTQSTEAHYLQGYTLDLGSVRTMLNDFLKARDTI